MNGRCHEREFGCCMEHRTMSAATKRFDLGTVLSITTGRLLAPIGNVYEILNWMTGDDLFTHQLPRASAECEPSLREQFPHLAEIEVPTLSGEDAYRLWLELRADEYGAMFDVAPLAADDHTRIDPLEELALHYPGKPVVVVNPEDLR